MASNRRKTEDRARMPLATLSGHNNQNTNPRETCDIHRFLKEHPFLSKLLREDGILFECDGEAPSPSKDYGQLQITMDKVILRWWKITLRNVEGSIYPGEIKDSYEEFFYDEVAQREILRIFGQATLDHCLNIVHGKFNWLTNLPLNIQIRILSYVNLEDIPHASLASKSWRLLCRNNDLWRIFYVRYYGRHALENRDLIHLAERRGWRHVFFTNRLKLQMELRREGQNDRRQREDPSDLMRARGRRGSQIQPSPPTTPRQQQQQPFVPPSFRRHSFAIRKEPPALSPRTSLLADRAGSPRTPRSYMGELPESSETRRPVSPSLSLRSNAGSVASTASAQPPVQPSDRSSKRH